MPNEPCLLNAVKTIIEIVAQTTRNKNGRNYRPMHPNFSLSASYNYSIKCAQLISDRNFSLRDDFFFLIETINFLTSCFFRLPLILPSPQRGKYCDIEHLFADVRTEDVSVKGCVHSFRNSLYLISFEIFHFPLVKLPLFVLLDKFKS